MQPTRNIIPHSNRIAVRVSDTKPGVMYQTQTTGIEFDNGVRYATDDCPKCGHSNSGIYFRGQEEYLKKHSAQVHCCNCGIPYPVEIPA